MIATLVVILSVLVAMGVALWNLGRNRAETRRFETERRRILLVRVDDDKRNPLNDAHDDKEEEENERRKRRKRPGSSQEDRSSSSTIPQRDASSLTIPTRGDPSTPTTIPFTTILEIGADPVISLDYDAQGRRLNFLANLPQPLDFHKHFYAPLAAAQKNDVARRRLESAFQEMNRLLSLHDPHPITLDQADAYTRLRFLQADDLDPVKATKRLRRAVNWTSQGFYDEMASKPNVALLTRAYNARPMDILGYDKKGRVVTAERVGYFFGASDAVYALTLQQSIYYLAHIFSRSTEMNRHRIIAMSGKESEEHPIVGYVYIGDLTGLRIFNAIKLLPWLKTVVETVTPHFPETVCGAYIINAPSFVPGLWDIVCKFLDPKTVKKFRFFSNVPKEFLVEELGAEVLPPEWGGTNLTAKLEKCPKHIDAAFDAAYPPVKDA